MPDDTTVYETREKSYTRHVSELELDTGETRTVEWDSMNQDSDTITFKRYVGYNDGGKKITMNPGSGGSLFGTPRLTANGGFQSEAFLMVPMDRVVWFETVERKDRTMEYEVEVDD